MKGFIGEFREFAMRGNVMDMAVGIVIGAAFGQIVNSMVNDVITPPIGLITAGVDFSQATVTLRQAETTPEGDERPAVVLAYGRFLNTILNFVIVALAIFIVIKAMNESRRRMERLRGVKPTPEPDEEPAPSTEVQLLTEIRDALVRR